MLKADTLDIVVVGVQRWIVVEEKLDVEFEYFLTIICQNFEATESG